MTSLKLASALVGVLGLCAFALPASAAAIVKIDEAGEGGQAMTLKLEPATVAAGPVVFQVHNDAVSEEHEMILVHLKSADQEIPVDATKHRVDEDQLESLGEVEDIKPGATGEMNATLVPGTYLVFCNIKGHYEAGMQARLTVTP